MLINLKKFEIEYLWKKMREDAENAKKNQNCLSLGFCNLEEKLGKKLGFKFQKED